MPLDKLYSSVRSNLPVDELSKYLSEKEPFSIERFSGSLFSFLLKFLSAHEKSVIVITDNEEEAQSIKSDLDELGVHHSFFFPSSGHKPYDQNQVVDPVMLVHRSEILDQMNRSGKQLIITSTPAIFEKISSPKAFEKASVRIQKQDDINPIKLTQTLSDQGYQPVSFVDEPGEYALRGGILDVFPFTGSYPVRLEFFGDQVESIREFDPDSQRSVAYLNEVRLVPDLTGLSTAVRDSLLSHVSRNSLIVLKNDALIQVGMQESWEHAKLAYEQIESAYPEPKDVFVSPVEFNALLPTFRRIYSGHFNSNIKKTIRINAQPQPSFNSSVKLLRENIQENNIKGFETIILCDNKGQYERLEELLGEQGEPLRYRLILNSLHEGFILNDLKVAVYTDHQIFNRYHRPKLRQRKHRGGFSLKEIKDLHVGDYVVHVDYGIGKFAGFTKIKVRDSFQEAVIVKYAEDSILYINVTSLHKLQKYAGKDGAVPKITKLGSGEWQRKKSKTRSRIKDIARELIVLYAKRKTQKAFSFSGDNPMLTELEASFEFMETADQMKAIDDVKRDMTSALPMDRLVCGDVGFGKTEVAVRAAFRAVADGKQVAVLVPTTILADQHWKTFRRRMGQFPVNIEMISRFRQPSDIKKVLNKTESGEIDILIGTHRLTSSDVIFKDLGLLIVDEEQRFGVATKEKLKKWRAAVDVLTLTATPIPRTLQFSLMGARDLSIINTPPPNRQPVYTEIHGFDSTLIRDAIKNEINRNGQVFFIHNRIQNIEELTGMIRELIPDVRIRFAHGQMSGSELEKIISQFYNHKFDVLVSTNIVENGIDIGNANTIIINRADQFGLSELHQLRGRVGRSNRKAFCYLITPPLRDLSSEARKRLLALVEYSDLGSGFNIAMRDLDIRGAGDMLGGEQSGYINDIGFELYSKILNDAVRELKETEFRDLFDDISLDVELPETTVEFDLTAQLDKSYVSDDVERLNLYRSLAKCTSQEDVHDWKTALNDRFGEIPENANTLISAALIKIHAAWLYLQKVTIRSGKIWLELPDGKSPAGQEYYERGHFSELLSKLETNKPNAFRITNKDDKVRIVVDQVETLDDVWKVLFNLNSKTVNAASA